MSSALSFPGRADCWEIIVNSYLKFIGKKIIFAILTIFAISIFAFLIVHLLPGDPVRAMLGAEADEAAVEATREALHLNEPLVKQYLIWINDVLHLDFGRSLVLNQSIYSLISERLPITLLLTVPAMVISVIFGILIGIICATHRGSIADQVLTVIMTTMNGVPIFWIGILLMYFFGVQLGWLPLMGYVSPAESITGYLSHAALPVFIQCFGPMSSIARQVRTNMLDVINQDYIRTAKAYGLPTYKIRYRYALKNVLIPVITLIALQVRSIVGGSLLSEQVFSIPGISRLITMSVMNNDFLTVQALTLVISAFVVVANLILEILYGFVDPRIRITGGKAE